MELLVDLLLTILYLFSVIPDVTRPESAAPASSSEPRPSTSRQSHPPQPTGSPNIHANWAHEFVIPWAKMSRRNLMSYMERDVRPPPSARREMVCLIIDNLLGSHGKKTSLPIKIEVVSATKSLKRQIDVVFNNITLKYGETYKESPCTVGNQVHTNHRGRWALRLCTDHASQRSNDPSHHIAQSSRSWCGKPKPSDRQRPKKSPPAHRENCSRAGKRKSKSKTQQASEESSTTSWYCFLCGDDCQENMLLFL